MFGDEMYCVIINLLIFWLIKCLILLYKLVVVDVKKYKLILDGLWLWIFCISVEKNGFVKLGKMMLIVWILLLCNCFVCLLGV